MRHNDKKVVLFIGAKMEQQKGEKVELRFMNRDRVFSAYHIMKNHLLGTD